MDMRETNKRILMDEIRMCSRKPINRERAAYLDICRGAYKSICMVTEADDDQDHAQEFNRQMAVAWISNMINVDGTKGPHWNLDKTQDIQKQFGISCDPEQFWVAMNMMYSDYCKVAENLGVNTLEFYACMAKAFLEDPDAKPGKLARYYEYIAG